MASLRFLSVIILLTVGALVDVSLSTTKEHKNTRIYKHGDIILGGLFPIHLVKQNESCSDLRSNVLMYAEAMMFAVDEINKNGSILKNITLGYDIRDTCGNDQEGVSIASDFVFRNTLKFDRRFLLTNSCIAQVTPPNEKPILAVIGGLDSRISVNVANVLQVVDVPQISYGASSAELSSSEFTAFFRTVPVDDFQSRAMAELVSHYKWTCVAVIGVDDWYGRSGVDAFVSAANDTGICIVMRQLFPVHDDSGAHIPQVITRLKNMNHVQIIILYSLVPQAIKVFEEALKQGMTGKTWIASDGWAESDLITKQLQFRPIIQGAIGFGFHGFQFKEFEQHIIKVSPLADRGAWWNEFWENEFNCSAVNFSSLFHEPCSGQERISLEKYTREYSQGVIPYVRDAVYSVAYALKDLFKCNSQGSLCSDRISALRPEYILRSLKNLSFQGITGHLDFEKGEVEAAYDIHNLQETPQRKFNRVMIGVWNMGKAKRLNVRDELMQWHQNVKPRETCGEICKPGSYRSTPNLCFWECVPCDLDTVSETQGSSLCTRCPKGFISNHNNTKCEEVPVRFVEWRDAWGISLSVFTVGCVICTLVVMAIVIQWRNTPIIQDTGGILNILLLVLVVLSFSFNLIHLSKLTDTTCRLFPPIFYFIYTGGALVQFLKVYRIRVLVNPLKFTASAKNRKNRYKSVLSIVAGLWFFPVFIALIWIIVDPPDFEKNIATRLIVNAACKPYRTSAGMVFRYFCACYLAMILFAAIIVAYSTKSLPHGHRFDEAKHIAFSLTLFGVTFATFFPGWSLLVGPSLTVFACLTNLAAATGTLACIFAPKLWLIYRFPHHNTQAYIRPALPEVRTARTSTLLSIGRFAMAIGANERPSPMLRSSPSGSSRTSPGPSPKGILKRATTTGSARNSPNQRSSGGPTGRPTQVKSYV